MSATSFATSAGGFNARPIDVAGGTQWSGKQPESFISKRDKGFHHRRDGTQTSVACQLTRPHLQGHLTSVLLPSEVLSLRWLRRALFSSTQNHSHHFVPPSVIHPASFYSASAVCTDILGYTKEKVIPAQQTVVEGALRTHR